MARLRATTVFMSTETGPATTPYSPGMGNGMSDTRAPDLVLAGQAVDVGTRTADPAPLHDGYLLAGLRPYPQARYLPPSPLPITTAS
jgi:hypothetical protein